MMCAIAQPYINPGDVQKGTDKSVEAYTACERVMGEDSQQTITASGLMSSANALKGDLQEAARTSEIVLKSRRRYDERYVSTVLAMQSLALIYEGLKEFK